MAVLRELSARRVGAYGPASAPKVHI